MNIFCFIAGCKFSKSFIRNLDSIMVQYELPLQCEEKDMTELENKIKDKLDKVFTLHCSNAVLSLKGTLDGFPDKHIEFLVKGGQVSFKATLLTVFTQ